MTPGEPGKKPVKIKLIDAKTKEEIPDSPLYVDAALVCTGRVPNTQGLEPWQGIGPPGPSPRCARCVPRVQLQPQNPKTREN